MKKTITQTASNKYRQILFVVFAFALVASLSFLLTAGMSKTVATDFSGFKAGNIISNEVMADYTSMTETEIQTFLDSKNACDHPYDDTIKYWEGRGYKYHIENNKVVCMAHETFDGETAAHIIWQAAQDYKISPKVLIVLLEKEQALVTDTWPYSGQYKAATGFYCPDTAPCNEAYGSFKKQVNSAAKLFREVLDGGWTNYPLGNNFVQYSPNKDCGGSVVNIENLATSALYRYTPYQPNADAIKNYPGTATCGAYGNRNFYAYYTDWFGSTHAKVATEQKAVEGNIPNGTYTIASAVNNKYVLDISGASTANSANLQLYSANGTNAQKFQVAFQGSDYYIITNINSKKALDVAAAGTVDRTNIWQYDVNYSCAQLWKIVENSDKTYTFLNKCSNKAMDMQGYTAKDGVNVWLYGNGSEKTQKFVLTPNPAEIRAAREAAQSQTSEEQEKTDEEKEAERKAAEEEAAKRAEEEAKRKAEEEARKAEEEAKKAAEEAARKAAEEEAARKAAEEKAAAEKAEAERKAAEEAARKAAEEAALKARPVQDGVYTIRSSINGGFALDISAASRANEANLQLWNMNNTAAQNFKFTFQKDNYYLITNTNSNRSLDVQGAQTANGTNIWQYTTNYTCAQLWKVVKNTDNTYSFFSKCSNKVIDVSGARIAAGTNIQLWQWNGTGAQRFTLQKR